MIGPHHLHQSPLSLVVGGLKIELSHGRGETDDATYAWLPDKRILISGDFVIWAFPNAGNPRKVQRFAPDWGAALRRMQALDPTVLVPGHGPVVFGAQRAAQILNDGAEVLENLVMQTTALMNKGCSLDEILHTVSASQSLLAKPYLLPKYDDPEFVVRGMSHLYAGWFDANPAHLKPAADAELAAEIVTLAGGAKKLLDARRTLPQRGRLDLRRI